MLTKGAGSYIPHNTGGQAGPVKETFDSFISLLETKVTSSHVIVRSMKDMNPVRSREDGHLALTIRVVQDVIDNRINSCIGCIPFFQNTYPKKKKKIHIGAPPNFKNHTCSKWAHLCEPPGTVDRRQTRAIELALSL